MARATTRTRKARPGLESLEGRQLLDGGGLSLGFGPGAAEAGMAPSPVELRSDSLDADVIDIEARTSLNLLRPDEVVISFGAVQHKP